MENHLQLVRKFSSQLELLIPFISNLAEVVLNPILLIVQSILVEIQNQVVDLSFMAYLPWGKGNEATYRMRSNYLLVVNKSMTCSMTALLRLLSIIMDSLSQEITTLDTELMLLLSSGIMDPQERANLSSHMKRELSIFLRFEYPDLYRKVFMTPWQSHILNREAPNGGMVTIINPASLSMTTEETYALSPSYLDCLIDTPTK